MGKKNDLVPLLIAIGSVISLVFIFSKRNKKTGEKRKWCCKGNKDF